MAYQSSSPYFHVAWHFHPEIELTYIVESSGNRFVGDSIRLFEQWRAAGKVAELHIYGTGGHGFCLRPTNQSVDTWLDRFRDFLAVQGFTDKHQD